MDPLKSRYPDMSFSLLIKSAFINFKNKVSYQKDPAKEMALHQGDCVHLINGEELFQVIGIDTEHQKCWLRRWPLLPKGSPVFEISTQKIACPYKQD